VSEVDSAVRAALAVLAGRPAAEVGREFGEDEATVRRWSELLVDGGRRRLAAELDPCSDDTRERFFTLVSHELRTPLAVIAGWVETLRTTELPPDATRQALDVIARHVAALERTASNAADAGALARNQLRLAVRPVELRELVARALAAAQEHPSTLVDGVPVTVIADPARLEQVTGELLAHARRLAGGSPLRVSVSAEDGAASVAVRVTGAVLGFDEAAALFEPYRRSDTSIGTGLGLFLCRALLDAHNGEIGVRAERDATEFWVRLPLDRRLPSRSRAGPGGSATETAGQGAAADAQSGRAAAAPGSPATTTAGRGAAGPGGG
jgi:signal transduction histidine kinase